MAPTNLETLTAQVMLELAPAREAMAREFANSDRFADPVRRAGHYRKALAMYEGMDRPQAAKVAQIRHAQIAERRARQNAEMIDDLRIERVFGLEQAA